MQNLFDLLTDVINLLHLKLDELVLEPLASRFLESLDLLVKTLVKVVENVLDKVFLHSVANLFVVLLRIFVVVLVGGGQDALCPLAEREILDSGFQAVFDELLDLEVGGFEGLSLELFASEL